MGSQHKNAMRVAKARTIFPTKSQIAASPSSERLISRIIRPNSCLLFTMKLYRSSSVTTLLELVAAYEHGLTGRRSNQIN